MKLIEWGSGAPRSEMTTNAPCPLLYMYHTCGQKKIEVVIDRNPSIIPFKQFFHVQLLCFNL